MLRAVGRRLAAHADAIGNADAVVGIAGKTQAWQSRHALVNLLDALLVPDRVLGHGPAPARYLGVLRIEADSYHALAQDVDEFVAHDGDQGVVVLGQQGFVAHAAKEGANHGPAGRRAAQELAMGEGAGQQ